MIALLQMIYTEHTFINTFFDKKTPTLSHFLPFFPQNLYVRGCGDGDSGGGGELRGCGEGHCGEGCKRRGEGGREEVKTEEVEQVTAQASGETGDFK